jgi:hypothetical protein
MVALKRFSIQLSALMFGEAIIAAGGKCIVCKADSPDKETIYSPTTELAISNPLTPVRGKIEFSTLDTVLSVDLYIQAPGGQFLVERGVKASGPNEFIIDTRRMQQTYVLPFSIADTTATTETNTGIAIPTNGAVQPNPLLRVTAIDATETIDVGTLSTDSGDADGFLAAAAVGVLGLVKGSLLASGATLGALLFVLDSANAGDDAPEQDVASAGKDITYTLTAGSDTAKGFIYLPINLAA